MIHELKLERWKTFEDLDLLDITPVTLLGGQNAVGKTALLESILLFYNPGVPELFLRHVPRFALEAGESAADGLEDTPVLRISVADAAHRGELVVRGAVVSQALCELEIEYLLDSQPRHTHLTVSQTPDGVRGQFDPGPVQGFPPAMRQGAYYLGSGVQDAHDTALRFALLGDSQRQRVLEYMRAFEPSLVGFSAIPLPHLPGRPLALYAGIGRGRLIPLASLGEGVGRVFSIVLAIESNQKGVVLIDGGVESGVHHSRLASLWKVICLAASAADCQVLATTYSYENLVAAYGAVAEAGVVEGFRYLRLDRRDQQIVGMTLTHQMLGAAIERGWDVR